MENYLTLMWLVLSAILVFMMQAGFAMVESGLTRSKNASNIIMKNIADISIGVLAYFFLGWAFMYGQRSIGGVLGWGEFALFDVPPEKYKDWFFQSVFAATAATIVSGAVCERTKFVGYLLISFFITAFIYTISGHWVWSENGWLSALGFHDFAGSTVVHSLGGWVALWAACIVGPRIGKYIRRNDGSTRVMAITGHNLPMVGLGTFILWFGWYGFNGGSTLSGTDISISHIMITTTLGAAGGTIGALFFSWSWYKRPDAPLTLNGALGGLVSITAGAYVFSPLASILVGILGGIIVILSSLTIEKVLKIDDPVGASSVHGVCGAWGTIAVGIFGNLDRLDTGLTRWEQIMVQTLGVGAFFVWASITSIVLLFALKKSRLLRVSRHDELEGLDISEHGSESYSGFQII